MRTDISKIHEKTRYQDITPGNQVYVVSGKRLAFDLDHCKGCGICAYQCKFGAITMKEGK